MSAEKGREPELGNWLAAALGLSCVTGIEEERGLGTCCTCDEEVGLQARDAALPPPKGAYAVHTFSRPWETPGLPDYIPPEGGATAGGDGPIAVEADSERAKLIAAERARRAKAALDKASQNVRDGLKEVSAQRFDLELRDCLLTSARNTTPQVEREEGKMREMKDDVDRVQVLLQVSSLQSSACCVLRVKVRHEQNKGQSGRRQAPQDAGSGQAAHLCALQQKPHSAALEREVNTSVIAPASFLLS